MRRKRNPRWCEECKCVMVYDRENDRYICPDCHGLFYPGDKEDHHVENDVIAALMREKYKSNLPPVDPLPAGEALKGAGGGSSKGKSKAGAMKKKSVNQLYKEL